MADALEILKTRRSLREFDGRSIAKEDLEKIVDAGPPRAHGAQCPALGIRGGHSARNAQSACPKSASTARFLSQSAAAVVVFSQETQYEVEDGSAATTCILLAAHALGIGSCWIAGHKKGLRPQSGGNPRRPTGLQANRGRRFGLRNPQRHSRGPAPTSARLAKSLTGRNSELIDAGRRGSLGVYWLKQASPPISAPWFGMISGA